MAISAKLPRGDDPRSPCFCSSGCNRGTLRPWKYFLWTSGALPPFDLLNQGVLLTFSGESDPSGPCDWKAQPDVGDLIWHIHITLDTDPQPKWHLRLTVDAPGFPERYHHGVDSLETDCGKDLVWPPCDHCTTPEPGLIPNTVTATAVAWNCDEIDFQRSLRFGRARSKARKSEGRNCCGEAAKKEKFA